MALLAKRVEAGADDAEVFGAGDRAEAARYFLLHFWHAHGPLGNVVGKRYGMVADEQQDGIGVQAKARQQMSGLKRSPASQSCAVNALLHAVLAVLAIG
jgi:hypothetical protein